MGGGRRCILNSTVCFMLNLVHFVFQRFYFLSFSERYESVAAFAVLTERETEGVINFRAGSLLKGSQHNIPAIVYF